MTKFALLCGSAPEDFRQKKILDMHDFLVSESGGFVPERNIVIFPNGVNELMLECTLNNVFDGSAGDEPEEILLYVCTDSPIPDSDESVFLRGEEIRRDVISYYADLAKKIEIGFQVIFDSDRELVNEESLGWEKIG